MGEKYLDPEGSKDYLLLMMLLLLLILLTATRQNIISPDVFPFREVWRSVKLALFSNNRTDFIFNLKRNVW